MSGRIVIDLFTTLDGVAQTPGGPEEDPSNGFPFGGWQAPLFDEAVGAGVDEAMHDMDALLLGRRTYDIFAGYWPQHTTVGTGKKVFPDGAAPAKLRLTTPPVTSDRGAVLLRHAPEPGIPQTGTMGE